MAKKIIAPVHPGEILFEEFVEPLGLSAYRVAKDIQVPITRITHILKGKRDISPDTAVRLARYFKMCDQFFINLQSHYDIELAKDSLEAGGIHIVPYGASA